MEPVDAELEVTMPPLGGTSAGDTHHRRDMGDGGAGLDSAAQQQSTLRGERGVTVTHEDLRFGELASTPAHLHPEVFALVDRTTSRVKSRHVTNFAEIGQTLRETVSPAAKLYTDQAKMYRQLGKQFASHESVNHSAYEWKRGDAHTNTIEGVFSVFKRGMIGTYQHCGEQHVKRYLAEFDFRYNNRAALEISDKQRADRALAGIEGKRLTYK